MKEYFIKKLLQKKAPERTPSSSDLKRTNSSSKDVTKSTQAPDSVSAGYLNSVINRVVNNVNVVVNNLILKVIIYDSKIIKFTTL